MANQIEIAPVLSPLAAFPRHKRDKRNKQRRSRPQAQPLPEASETAMQGIEGHGGETNRGLRGYAVGNGRKFKGTTPTGPGGVDIVI